MTHQDKCRIVVLEGRIAGYTEFLESIKGDIRSQTADERHSALLRKEEAEREIRRLKEKAVA